MGNLEGWATLFPDRGEGKGEGRVNGLWGTKDGPPSSRRTKGGGKGEGIWGYGEPREMGHPPPG